MSKLFIPTANVGKAHDADIYAVCVTNPYTITCSGDGYIKLWSNKLSEDDALAKLTPVATQHVHVSGLHHVDAFYSAESFGTVLIVAAVSFSGDIFFYRIVNDAFQPFTGLLTAQENKKSYWAVKWVKSDDLAVLHRLAAVDVKGTTYVWRLTVSEDATFNLESQGQIPCVGTPTLGTCVAVSSAMGLLATGFANGTVVVFQLSTLRPIYTFESFGMHGTEQNSNSVRCLEFSPKGTLLAVGNDLGSFGCVTLYETEFGERIGNLSVPTSTNLAARQNTSGSSVGTFAHNGWVFGLCFNSSGEYLVTCGYDSKLRVWDVKERDRVCTLNITAGDIEQEDEILLEDENGDSLKYPPIFDVQYFGKGVRSGMGNETNEGICCVCMDRSIRWYREAGGN